MGGIPRCGEGVSDATVRRRTRQGSCRSQRRHRCSPRSKRSLPTSTACPPRSTRSPRQQASRSTSSSSTATSRSCSTPACASCSRSCPRRSAGSSRSTDLRWISFAHVEADECGAMNQFLAAAPNAQVVHGGLACMLSLNDMADRPPRPMADDEVLDIGGHRMRFLPTPHVPHNWESGLWFDETHRDALRRRPVHARRRRPRGDRAATSSSRRWQVRRSSTPPRSARTSLRRSVGSPTLEPDDAGDDARVVVSGQRCTTARGAGSRLRDLRRRPGRVTEA